MWQSETNAIHTQQQEYVINSKSNINNDLIKRFRIFMIDDFIRWHYIFNMRQETLFLSIYVFDKFLSLSKVYKDDLNLICISSLFLACKFEEVKIYSLSQFINNSRSSITKEDILMKEAEILACLQFRLTIVSPYDFLKRIFHLNEQKGNGCILKRHTVMFPTWDLSL